MPFTVVSLHAHPDDEALLTGGTLARAAAAGHRIVLATATLGEQGLAAVGRGGDLAAARRGELSAAAAALGAQDVRWLGFADSGMDGRAGGAAAFSRMPTERAAERVAALLAETAADVLTIYDPAGGYGHPDHVAVYRVGTAAARIAGTPVVLEATVDRARLVRLLRFVRAAGLRRPDFDPGRFAAAYAEPTRISHEVDVRAFCMAKRAAMAAHVSQAGGGEAARALALFLRLPAPVFRLVFGREWFVEQGRPGTPLGAGRLDDVFASLRAVGR